MTAHKDRAWLRLLLAAALAAGLLLALRAAFAAADALHTLSGGGYSLRAAAPLTDAQQENAQKAAADQGLDIAFWGETSAAVQAKKDPAPATQAAAKGILCAGKPALALGAQYRYGRAPAAAETDACAVSLPLAEALWGGQDVCGQTLLWQDRAYTVCGVAEGTSAWLLCPAPEGSAFAMTGIELAGLPAGDPRGAAQTVARAAGLDEGAILLLPGDTLVAAAGLLAWLPLMLAGLALIGKAAALALRRLGPGPARQGALFAAALGLALALPQLLAALPAWLIPNRWSDFTTWQTLLALPAETLQSLLAAPPTVRDIALRRWLLQSAAATAAALLMTAALFAVLRPGKDGG